MITGRDRWRRRVAVHPGPTAGGRCRPRRRLYSRAGDPPGIRVFDVSDDDGLTSRAIHAVCTVGRFDGIRLDDAGRIWAAAWDGVHCFAPDGTLIGKLLLSESVANLTFGGPKRNHLYITAGASLYALRVTVGRVTESGAGG